MTIALAIFNFYDHGAARRDFRDLALELVRRGHRVVVLTKHWHAEMLPDVRHVKLASRGCGKVGKLLAFGKSVRNFCAENHVDVLVGFSRIAGADFYYLGDHAMHEHAFRWWRIFSPDFWLERHLAKQLAAPSAKTTIFALSPRQIDTLMRDYHTPQAHLKLLPYGVPAESHRPPEKVARAFRDELCERYSIPADAIVLAMVGAGFHNKGVDRAVAALSFLPAEESKRFRLVVGGKGSVSKMDALARHYNVREALIFAETPSRAAILSAADMVLCLARHDVLESTPLEAIACGTPAVVTKCNDFCDFVEDCGGVVLPEPFSASSLTKLLRKLLAEPEYFKGLKQRVLSQDPDSLYHRVEMIANQIESVRK